MKNTEIELERRARTFSDYQLMKVAEGKKHWLFGTPERSWQEICGKELINRGFNEEKFEEFKHRLEKRNEDKLGFESKFFAFFAPSDKIHEMDLDRYRKYGFTRKIQQYYIYKFLGIIFYFALTIFVMYKLN